MGSRGIVDFGQSTSNFAGPGVFFFFLSRKPEKKSRNEKNLETKVAYLRMGGGRTLPDLRMGGGRTLPDNKQQRMNTQIKRVTMRE